MSGFKMTPRTYRAHRIRVLRPTATNTKGDVSRTWSAIAVRWASRRPLRSDEMTEAQRTRGQVFHEIVFPRVNAIDGTHRLEETVQGTARTYNIDGITERDGRLREHVCTCVEEV